MVKRGRDASTSPPAAPKAQKTADSPKAKAQGTAQGHGQSPSQSPSRSAGPGDASTAKALAAAQSHGPQPPRPATDDNVPEMDAYFNRLAVWVHRMVQEAVKTKAPGLRATDFEQKSPHQFGALPIRGKADAEGSSYKAPWCQATARMSLGSTGRYEAGGNVMWLNLVPQGDEARVLAGKPGQLRGT